MCKERDKVQPGDIFLALRVPQIQSKMYQYKLCASQLDQPGSRVLQLWIWRLIFMVSKYQSRVAVRDGKLLWTFLGFIDFHISFHNSQSWNHRLSAISLQLRIMDLLPDKDKLLNWIVSLNLFWQENKHCKIYN